MKSAVVTLSLIAGAVIGWVDTNLGELFWIVLTLTIADILVGIVKDAFSNTPIQLTPGKMLKGLAAVGIPVFVRTFAVDATGANIHYALQTAFAAIIVVQLTAILPVVYSLLQKTINSLSMGNKSVARELSKLSEAELLTLINSMKARVEKDGATPSEVAIIGKVVAAAQEMESAPKSPLEESGKSSSSSSSSSSNTAMQGGTNQ